MRRAGRERNKIGGKKRKNISKRGENMEKKKKKKDTIRKRKKERWVSGEGGGDIFKGKKVGQRDW